MILIEFFENIIKTVVFLVLRFVFWIVTARDCKHCKYGRLEHYTYDEEYECTVGLNHGFNCRNTITRKDFVRKDKNNGGNKLYSCGFYGGDTLRLF